MKVALIGASGFVGTAVLKELLQKGHQVTAIVRNPEKIEAGANVKIVKANVLSVNEVEEAVNQFSKETITTGFYSYGEISPLLRTAKCELHNQTMTITTYQEV